MNARFAMLRSSALCCAALLALALPSHADIRVIDYDESEPIDFRTDAYAEDGTRTKVNSGHFEIQSDGASLQAGDRAFNVDEEQFGLSRVTLSVDGGHLFDALSLEIVNPSDAPGEYVISAIGGSGASLSAPTVAGPLVLGPEFSGITALVITQNAPGAFAIDDVTLRVLPEPGSVLALLVSALALSALRRRRVG